MGKRAALCVCVLPKIRQSSDLTRGAYTFVAVTDHHEARGDRVLGQEFCKGALSYPATRSSAPCWRACSLGTPHG